MWGKAKLLMCMVIMFLIPLRLHADQVIMKTGEMREGEIIEDHDSEILFEHEICGHTVQVFIKKDNIQKIITKDGVKELQPEKSTYYLIPIEGQFGVDITVELAKQWVTDIRTRKPECAILIFDTIGGRVSSLEKIIEIFDEIELPKYAFIKNDALSAGAVLAMACDKIYVNDNVRFGAAKVWSSRCDGMPQEVGEKFESAFRSFVRGVAIKHGHQKEIAEAITDQEIELHIIKDEGKPRVAYGEGDVMLVKKGKMLCMTSDECLQSGLAEQMVESPEDILKIHGHNDLLCDSNGKRHYVALQRDRQKAEEFINKYDRLYVKALEGVDQRVKYVDLSRPVYKNNLILKINSLISLIQQLHEYASSYPDLADKHNIQVEYLAALSEAWLKERDAIRKTDFTRVNLKGDEGQNVYVLEVEVPVN